MQKDKNTPWHYFKDFDCNYITLYDSSKNRDLKCNRICYYAVFSSCHIVILNAIKFITSIFILFIVFTFSLVVYRITIMNIDIQCIATLSILLHIIIESKPNISY